MKNVLILLLGLIIISSCNREPKHKLNDDGLWDSIPENFYIRRDTTVHQNFYDKQYGFKIWFPSKPSITTDTVRNNGIDVIYKNFYVDRVDSFYFVTVVAYPQQVLQDQPPVDILQSAHMMTVENQGLYQDYFAIDTVSYPFPVLFYKVRGQNLYIAGMNIMVKNVLYQVFAANTKQYPSQQTLNRFIGTFQIVVKD